MGFRRLPPVTDSVCVSRGVASGKRVHSINQTRKETQTPKSKYFQTTILNINTWRLSSEDWLLNWLPNGKQPKKKRFLFYNLVILSSRMEEWHVSLHFLHYPCVECTHVSSLISSPQDDRVCPFLTTFHT